MKVKFLKKEGKDEYSCMSEIVQCHDRKASCKLEDQNAFVIVSPCVRLDECCLYFDLVVL